MLTPNSFLFINAFEVVYHDWGFKLSLGLFRAFFRLNKQANDFFWFSGWLGLSTFINHKDSIWIHLSQEFTRPQYWTWPPIPSKSHLLFVWLSLGIGLSLSWYVGNESSHESFRQVKKILDAFCFHVIELCFGCSYQDSRQYLA